MKNVKQSKNHLLFDPDSIITEIHRALSLDFKQAQHEYCLNDSFTLYAFNRQVNEFRKKYVNPATQDVKELEDRTFAKFRGINDHMYQVNSDLRIKLPWPNVCPVPYTTREDLIHKRARQYMHSILGKFSVSEWFTECRNSGGSSIGVPFIDTSNEKKFRFPMSVTKEAESLFNQALLWDSRLRESIKTYNGFFPVGEKYEVVSGSRATTVEKNSEIRRMICPEPTCNMYLQLGLMQVMYKRMKSWSLDVESLPERHKKLAWESSITQKNATIDWSSASDCVSIVLLRWLLPPAWFRIVESLRCKETTIQGVSTELNMVSTMGNAVTFPLETLVFWAYANAINLTNSTDSLSLFPEWDQPDTDISVFGDDCIVPSHMAKEFISTMESVGFIINDEMSYYKNEQFRESCGGDYLCGFDVRPYCCKAPHSTRQSSLEPWLYIIANSLLKKYITYFGRLSYVYDKELWRTIFSLFTRHNISVKLVPSYFPDDSGLKLSYDIERFQNHYSFKLQRIAKSHQGTVSFNYCRFVYRQECPKFGELQFALWLKKPSQTKLINVHGEGKSEGSAQNPLKKVGGYVVAKGISCHWHVPTLSG